MLTSFFRKSKPANFLSIVLIGLFFYILYNFQGLESTTDWTFILQKSGGFLGLLLLYFFINFILFKDKSEGRHAYVLLFIFLFTISIPGIFKTPETILSGVFIVLGLRRSIQMQTGKYLNQKIFDSFFCFSLAALFVPSTLFFMIVPLWAIIYYNAEDYRSWLIPITAISSVFILKTSIDLLVSDRFFNVKEHFFFAPIQFQALSPLILSYVGVVTLFVLWILRRVMAADPQASQREKRANYLLFITVLAAVISIFFSGKTDPDLQETWLFLFIPFALILGKFYDLAEPTKKNEILLLILCLLCIAMGITLNFSPF